MRIRYTRIERWKNIFNVIAARNNKHNNMQWAHVCWSANFISFIKYSNRVRSHVPCVTKVSFLSYLSSVVYLQIPFVIREAHMRCVPYIFQLTERDILSAPSGQLCVCDSFINLTFNGRGHRDIALCTPFPFIYFNSIFEISEMSPEEEKMVHFMAKLC